MNLTRAFIVLLAISAGANATPIVSSTFDTGDEGWIVGSFLTPTGPTTTPNYVATGGNPGGYLHADDFAPWSGFQAPAKFQGDLSVAYGALLRFDIRVAGVDGVTYSAVILSNGTTTLQYRGNPTVGDWYRYQIPLLASAGWEHSTDGKSVGEAATEAELQAVLANIQFLHINADWLTGMDYAELDNVMIANPEPSTMLLLGTATLVLAGIRRARSAKRTGPRF